MRFFRGGLLDLHLSCTIPRGSRKTRIKTASKGGEARPCRPMDSRTWGGRTHANDLSPRRMADKPLSLTIAIFRAYRCGER